MRISDWSLDVCSSDLRSECLASRSGPLDPAQTILIPNHLTQHPLPSLKTDEGRFVSVFENSRGQQLILIVDKTTKTGQFSAGEAGWRIENISSDKIDRKSVVTGKSVSVRVDLGGRRNITKKKRYR